ncbi:outer membrane beta-barrel protein [Dyadobacter alkalitolerans]|uniref:outer membrane beta-barrel protein n=1 Tax=Dyadobacter alkalitolerans TaxID=492736 RepID=UPI00047D4DDF|nr:outer membrane beta-barrel protein [Dyadobacter alkalitolerans]
MKSIFSALLLLPGFLLSGPGAISQSKFALSATVAPYYGHIKSRVEAMLPDPNGSGAITSQVLRSEISPKGYWAGLNGRYSFSQKWSVSTGFWFNHSSTSKSGTKSRSHHFSIPVIANLQITERKLSPYLSAGALWNFGTTSRLTIPDLGTVTFKSDRNTSRISSLIGAGVIYHFAERLSLVAQPTFTYAIPPSNINIHAYQLSLNVQLMLKL